MSDWDCKPATGKTYKGIGDRWAHWVDGNEEWDVVYVDLVDVSTTAAQVTVTRGWDFNNPETLIINKGTYEEYPQGSDRDWRVWVDDVAYSTTPSEALAAIRICFGTDDTPPPPPPALCSDNTTQATCEAAGCLWHNGACYSSENTEPGADIPLDLYGSVSVLGADVQMNSLACDVSSAVIDVSLGHEGRWRQTLFLGATAGLCALGTIVTGGLAVPVLIGGLYIALNYINDACDQATFDILDGTFTEDDRDVMYQDMWDVINVSDIDATDAEIDKAIDDAIEEVAKSDEEKQRQEDWKDGTITKEEYETQRDDHIRDVAIKNLLRNKFSITTPTILMADSPKNVTGIAPEKLIEVNIMAVRKWYGFDFLATDTEIATATSGDDYKYATPIELGEFGFVDVYGKVRKEVFGVDWLKEDLKTTKHTVIVLTWIVIAAIVILLAVVLDKKYGFLGLKKGGTKRKKR